MLGVSASAAVPSPRDRGAAWKVTRSVTGATRVAESTHRTSDVGATVWPPRPKVGSSAGAPRPRVTRRDTGPLLRLRRGHALRGVQRGRGTHEVEEVERLERRGAVVVVDHQGVGARVDLPPVVEELLDQGDRVLVPILGTHVAEVP